MMDTFSVEDNDAIEYGFTFASDIGLTPGCWPQHIYTKDGDEIAATYKRERADSNDDGEIVRVLYLYVPRPGSMNVRENLMIENDQ